MENNLKSKTINGMLWSFLQKTSTQAINFVISVILARILAPSDYGIVAIAGMFLAIMSIFSDGGLGPAIIQQKEVDEKDYNTIFVSQFAFSSVLYVIVFLFAPLFASLFNAQDTDLLVSIIRVMALAMPLGALSGVQNSVITRRMMFKWHFYSSSTSIIFSAIVGIYMAYAGYGAWALVGQHITSIIVSTIVINYLLDWHPKFQFCYERFKPLFLTGLKYIGTSFIGTITTQVKGYSLGIKYSSADLAYYNRGEGLPHLICNNIDNSIQAVLFPALVKIQDNIDATKKALRRSIRISTYILFPILFGLATISDKIVLILYTDKWIPCIPFMRLTCFCFAVSIMCNVNLQALKARGLIGLILKMEIVKKPIMFIIIIVTMLISPIAIAWGILFFNIIVYFINSYPNKKNISYSYKEQLMDILPNTIQALLMAGIVYGIGSIEINIYLSVLLQIILGAALYIAMSLVFKNESFYYLINLVKAKIPRI